MIFSQNKSNRLGSLAFLSSEVRFLTMIKLVLKVVFFNCGTSTIHKKCLPGEKDGIEAMVAHNNH